MSRGASRVGSGDGSDSYFDDDGGDDDGDDDDDDARRSAAAKVHSVAILQLQRLGFLPRQFAMEDAQH